MSHDQLQAWRTVTIEDLGQVVTGRTPPSSKPEMFGSEYPFITPSDMSFGLRRITTERSISLVGSLALDRIKLPPKSVAFVCIGATIGKVCLTSEDSFTNQQINSIIVDCDRHSPEFVYYLMLGMVDKVKALAGGAATPIVNKSSFCGIPVSIPPIETQSKIAFILSAYDDLIENNIRRIEILEEMARRLYEEWFVQFRFPGHEGAGFKENELGIIPDGWYVKSFSELAIFLNGHAFKPADFSDDGVPIIKIKELNSGITDATPRFSGVLDEKYRIKNGDILFSWSAYLDAYIWKDGEGWLNQHLFKVSPSAEMPKLGLYFSLKKRMWEFRAKSSGATMQHIKRSALSEVKTVVPASDVMQKFEAIVGPFVNQVITLKRQIANLRAQRDLLLPKLISGEIDVSDIPMPA